MGSTLSCVSTRSSGTLLQLGLERSDGNASSVRSVERLPVNAGAAAAVNGSTWQMVRRRFPWLLVLMLVQSLSGAVVDHFSSLVEKHVVLASFLTMLVGGGGNSSGQTVVETVRLLARRDDASGGQPMPMREVVQILARELAVGAVLAAMLGVCAYPRVLLLSGNASALDALTIAIAYACIVTMANAIGVVVVMVLHKCEMAAVGAPPVVQVTVDVLGVLTTMLIAQAVLGDE